MELKIENISGSYPLVQAEGTIDGVEFYFRGSHGKWHFAVGPDPVGIMMGTAEGFQMSGEYESDGYMSEKLARRIIENGAIVFTGEPVDGEKQEDGNENR